MAEETQWTTTEITEGKFVTSNGSTTITVHSDFSGFVENDGGDFIEFKDLRDFIKGAKILEQALIDHYGGWA